MNSETNNKENKMDDTYIISNTHGQYWTGTCFGAKEAEEFASTDEAFWTDLPGLDAHKEGERIAWYSADDQDDVDVYASTERL